MIALQGYKFLRKICKYIPPKIAKKWLNGLSWIYWKLDVKNCSNVVANLETLGKASSQSGVVLQREVYRHFAYFFYEFFSQKDAFFENAEFLNQDLIEKLGFPGEKASLLLVSHTGNWEASLKYLLNRGYSVTTIVMPHSHPEVNLFFDQLRAHPNLETASLLEGLAHCAHAIKNKRVIALACERDYTGNGLALPMFDKNIYFPKGPAWLMMRYQVPTYLAKCHRTDLLRFNVKLEAIDLPIKLPESRNEAIARLSQGISRKMFDHILCHSEQWITFDPTFYPTSSI
jgi:lauroyl/myristoyl acyltransferase